VGRFIVAAAETEKGTLELTEENVEIVLDEVQPLRELRVSCCA
jgi:hypothetical protein